jgi:hypothetical protein
LNLEIFKQIEKELNFAELCHPNQQITKSESLQFAINKLKSCTSLNYPVCGINNCTCNDTDKYICNSFAAIAILIRGIEQELKVEESVVTKSFKKRLKLFNSLFKFRPQIKLSIDDVFVIK